MSICFCGVNRPIETMFAFVMEMMFVLGTGLGPTCLNPAATPAGSLVVAFAEMMQLLRYQSQKIDMN
jgi:hypothetical protein